LANTVSSQVRRRRAGRAGDLQIRIALVVAEQDVELGVQRLDEVVFQQQRLGLGAHHRGLHAGDLADHVADAGAAMVLGEVARYAPLQVARLAHIQQRALRVEIAVDARQRGQGRYLREQFFGMHIRHMARIVAACRGRPATAHAMAGTQVLHFQ
jgi:hypothetical protein